MATMADLTLNIIESCCCLGNWFMHIKPILKIYSTFKTGAIISSGSLKLGYILSE